MADAVTGANRCAGKPRAGGGITLRLLIDEGILSPGENVLTVEYKSSITYATLMPDGRISCSVSRLPCWGFNYQGSKLDAPAHIRSIGFPLRRPSARHAQTSECPAITLCVLLWPADCLVEMLFFRPGSDVTVVGAEASVQVLSHCSSMLVLDT